MLSDGRTLSYEYDAEERITKVIDSVDGTTEYTYDALGQLLTETVNGELVNKMQYDSYGNILQKNGNTYSYDEIWKDRLNYYNGVALTYDEQGNPLTYLGHTLTWEKGRQLKSFDNISYTYNANGIRTSKTVAGTKHEFTLDGTKILRETWNDEVLDFLYDNEDSVCGMIYNGVPYFYLKNLQGDIIAIADSKGDVVVRYSYDAWGKCSIEKDTSVNGSVASVNPFRYRGYYYDEEIGLYYLQSRYYDPNLGRFINADEVVFAVISDSAIGCNLFTYCENKAIQYIDPLGYASYSNKIVHNRRSGVYTIFTEIRVLWRKINYTYKVKNGVVSFDLTTNNYWSVIWRGVEKTLAEAIYKAAKYISSSYLKGRTIGGLNTELLLHWAGYLLGIKKERCKVVDMGGRWGIGYDYNAWWFETANSFSIAHQVKRDPWAVQNQIKRIWRYL